MPSDLPAVVPATMRDDAWLCQLLDSIWNNYFADVPKANDIVIEFARQWKSRLGLIRMTESQSRTYIGINGLLRYRQVPESVVLITTAHELCHYAHGFGSPLPQLYPHPHAGNVVGQELERRGLSRQLATYDNWVGDRWTTFYENMAPVWQPKRSAAAANTRAAAASKPRRS